VGDEIAVPDYSTGAIKWEKIASIKTLEPQHVYDLSIEGTRNFIANDIVAHNTYLATSSGNVGIGTTVPGTKLTVAGDANISGSLNVSSGLNVISGNVGIGTTNPTNKLTIGTDVAADGVAQLSITAGYFSAGGSGAGTTNGFVGGVYNNDAARFDIRMKGTALTDAKVTVLGSGNVGINTTVPAQTLTVQGTLNVTPSGRKNESLFIDANGNVGIGTAAPANKLHVNETNSGNPIPAFFQGGAINTGIGIQSMAPGGNQWTMYSSAPGGISDGGFTIRDSTNGVNALTIINKSGNVGIGTTGPGFLFEVSGTATTLANIKSSGDDTRLRLENTGTGGKKWSLISAGTSSGLPTSGFAIKQTTDGLVRLVIDDSGNVGIGTTNPDSALHINSSSDSGAFKITNGSGSNYTAFFVNATLGRVGIGTTGPAQTLAVIGNARFTTGIVTGITGAAPGSNRVNVGSQLNTDDSVLQLWHTGVNAYVSATYGSTGSYVPLVLRTSDTDRLTITTGGNVGIGTTAPLSLLHVNDSSTAGAIRVTNVSGTTIFFVNGSSGKIGIGTDGPSGTIGFKAGNSSVNIINDIVATTTTNSTFDIGIGDLSGGGTNRRGIIRFQNIADANNGTYIQFWTTQNGVSNAERMRIDNLGNVGIGTTSPAYALDIQPNTAPKLRLYDSVTPTAANYMIFTNTGGRFFVGQDSSTGNGLGNAALPYAGTMITESAYPLAFGTNNNINMVIKSGGNVGIGATSPNSTLQVGANTDAATNGIISAVGGDNAYQFMSVNTANNPDANEFFVKDDVGSIILGNMRSGSTFRLGLAAGGTTEMMTILPSGNVGIGTTSPGSTLTVQGTFNASGSSSGPGLYVNSTGGVGIGTTNPGGNLQVGVDGGTIQIGGGLSANQGGRFKFLTSNTATNWLIGSNQNVGSALEFTPSTATGGNIFTTPTMVISGGKVGIGTADPASTLTIVGNFSATGTKSAVVNTSYGIRKLYAMESPDIRFYDQGRASLTNGIANISLDPIFIETVEPDYIVYLTPEARTKGIYVAEKAKEYFVVKSYAPGSSIPFSWLISAVRKSYGATRMDLERKENTEITAVIDGKNKMTEVNINNLKTSNAPSEKQAEAANAITGKVTDEITKTNNENLENKFSVASSAENEIISQIKQNTKLDESEIKKYLKFKYKEPESGGAEESQEPETSSEKLTKISQVNGSVIIRLG